MTKRLNMLLNSEDNLQRTCVPTWSKAKVCYVIVKFTDDGHEWIKFRGIIDAPKNIKANLKQTDKSTKF